MSSISNNPIVMSSIFGTLLASDIHSIVMSSILKPAENPEISEAFEKMPMWWEFLEYRKGSKLKARHPRYLLSLFGGIVFSLHSETS